MLFLHFLFDIGTKKNESESYIQQRGNGFRHSTVAFLIY